MKRPLQGYYDLLNSTRITGNWEAWLMFFAEAVAATDLEKIDVVRRLNDSKRNRLFVYSQYMDILNEVISV